MCSRLSLLIPSLPQAILSILRIGDGNSRIGMITETTLAVAGRKSVLYHVR